MANRFCNLSIMLAIVILAITCGFVYSEDSASDVSGAQNSVTREKLEAIESEIQSLRNEAIRLSAQEDSIVTMLAQFDLQSQMKTHEIELLELKQEKTEDDIHRLEEMYHQ